MENNNETEKIYKYICNSCEFKCNYQSQWNIHIETELHKTGKKKIRSDCKAPFKCNDCNYITKNTITYKKHILNEHANKKEREEGFKYYCKYCDFGTFSNDTIELHYNTDKHKKQLIRQK